MSWQKVDPTAAAAASGEEDITEGGDNQGGGKEWLLATLNQYVTFKVKSRAYVAGRGYVTVVHNPDLLPIDQNKSVICKGQFRLPIHGIERSMTLMTIPRVMTDWGLITSEETIGDEITIRMYPDDDITEVCGLRPLFFLQ